METQALWDKLDTTSPDSIDYVMIQLAIKTKELMDRLDKTLPSPQVDLWCARIAADYAAQLMGEDELNK